MKSLQQQIAELPDDCEMFRQVTELDPLAVVPVGFTSQELKALINELTEKVERYERMMEQSIDHGGRSWMVRKINEKWVAANAADTLEPIVLGPFDTALEAFESLSK